MYIIYYNIQYCRGKKKEKNKIYNIIIIIIVNIEITIGLIVEYIYTNIHTHCIENEKKKLWEAWIKKKNVVRF